MWSRVLYDLSWHVPQIDLAEVWPPGFIGCQEANGRSARVEWSGNWIFMYMYFLYCFSLLLNAFSGKNGVYRGCARFSIFLLCKILLLCCIIIDEHYMSFQLFFWSIALSYFLNSVSFPLRKPYKMHTGFYGFCYCNSAFFSLGFTFSHYGLFGFASLNSPPSTSRKE